MRCVNETFKPSDVAQRNAVSAYMTNRGSASFADIRNDVPVVATLTDGELAQVCQDAGFRVENP